MCVRITSHFRKSQRRHPRGSSRSYCRLLPPRPIAKLLQGTKMTGAGDGNRTQLRLQSKLLNLGAIAYGLSPKPSITEPNSGIRIMLECLSCPRRRLLCQSHIRSWEDLRNSFWLPKPRRSSRPILFESRDKVQNSWQLLSKVPRFIVWCSRGRAHIKV
jgi:hypothetical protein